MKTKNVKSFIFSMVILAGFVFCGTAQANVAMMKAYKEAFPDTHPKCISCHVDAMPKKADGQHEWNAYGKAVIKASKDAGLDHPTADTFKKVGPIPNTN